jgi:hypothetical protein
MSAGREARSPSGAPRSELISLEMQRGRRVEMERRTATCTFTTPCRRPARADDQRNGASMLCRRQTGAILGTSTSYCPCHRRLASGLPSITIEAKGAPSMAMRS